MDALTSWLREPVETDDALALRRVLHLIQAAEDAAYEQGLSAATAAEDRALKALRLTHAREALAELRRRWVRRLDADASGLERQIAASLQGLEQDLLRGLQPYLSHRLSGGAIGRADLRPLIVEYVNSGAESWQRRAEQMLSSRYSEIASETDTLFRGVDWDVVNEVAGGPQRQYPSVLLEDLVAADGRLNLPQWHGASGTTTRPKSTTELVSLLRMAIAGSAVAVVAALLFSPAGPVVLLAGVAGAGGARLFERVLDRRAAVRIGELESRAVISELIEETLGLVRTHIQQTVVPVRNHLAEELRRLEAMMDQALAATQEPTGASAGAERDRVWLAEVRDRAVDAARSER
jgi:hypothetical protein